MFSPVGNRSPSVYWRRRIIVLGSVALLVVLLVLTVRAVAGGGGSDAPLGAGSTPAGTASATSSPPRTKASSGPKSTPAKTGKTGKTGKAGSRPSATSSGPRSATFVPMPCRARDLAVEAVVAKQSYQVGDEPMVELQVTNTGVQRCVQDLGDEQIVLKVYNGESRVWGSHDCGIQKGAAKRTLAVDASVRVAIMWSGLTSQPKCAGTRQRVGAGTYTLYAELSGKTGKATQFSIG